MYDTVHRKDVCELMHAIFIVLLISSTIITIKVRLASYQEFRLGDIMR